MSREFSGYGLIESSSGQGYILILVLDENIPIYTKCWHTPNAEFADAVRSFNGYIIKFTDENSYATEQNKFNIMFPKESDGKLFITDWLEPRRLMEKMNVGKVI